MEPSIITITCKIASSSKGMFPSTQQDMKNHKPCFNFYKTCNQYNFIVREKAHFSDRVFFIIIILFLQIVYMQNLQSAVDSRKCCKVEECITTSPHASDPKSAT